jgi:GNAT superfamily N-acetyltransferase
MISFVQASPEDAEALTAVQTRTFDDDSRKHGLGERGGPPGYDSVFWQIQIMRKSRYYKILADGKIIGGLIVFKMGKGHYELGRIYIDTDHQNQGIGAQALAFIERTFPARRWTLETPSWAKRNQHFYEKHGYIRIGTSADLEDIRYQKLIGREI